MIILSLPPSINATYKRGKNSFYKSSEAKAWQSLAWGEFKKQWKRKPIKGKVYLGIHWYFKRERDCDSGLKGLLDLLQLAQAYENDKQVYQINMTKGFDKDNSRVELEIEEII